MPFHATRLDIPEMVMIAPRAYEDQRGFFMETYKLSEFTSLGMPQRFVQDNFSHSLKGVLRGLHFQMDPKAQGKLVSVLRGEIFDVGVDLRRGSPTYGRWAGVIFSARTREMVFIPAGFAHGFCVLSQEADVAYKATAEYTPSLDRGIAWNDPQVGIQVAGERPHPVRERCDPADAGRRGEQLHVRETRAMTEILVTGAGGYIGSVLCRMLVEAGHSVLAVDRFHFGRSVLPPDGGRLRSLTLDIRALETMHLKGIEAVVDLAAISNDPAGELDPAKTWEINHQARARLARLAKTAGALVAGGYDRYRAVVEALSGEFDLVDIALAAISQADAGVRGAEDTTELAPATLPSFDRPARPPIRGAGTRPRYGEPSGGYTQRPHPVRSPHPAGAPPPPEFRGEGSPGGPPWVQQGRAPGRPVGAGPGERPHARGSPQGLPGQRLARHRGSGRYATTARWLGRRRDHPRVRWRWPCRGHAPGRPRRGDHERGRAARRRHRRDPDRGRVLAGRGARGEPRTT